MRSHFISTENAGSLVYHNNVICPICLFGFPDAVQLWL